MFTTRPTLQGTFGMVSSTHWLASQCAMAVLEGGGNAFDAAVAAGFVLHVVEPHLNGPAGEVPIILAPADGRPTVLCGQGPAPAGATIEHYTSLRLDLVPGADDLAGAGPAQLAHPRPPPAHYAQPVPGAAGRRAGPGLRHARRRPAGPVDHTVDDAAGQVRQELPELGADHDPVDASLVLDDLPLLESGGVVLLVDLGEPGPAQPGAGVVGVLLLAVDAGLQAEAVGGDAEVGGRALGDVGGQVVVEVERDLASAGLRRHDEVVPAGR